MSHRVRFNQMLLFLMAVALFSAFAMPPDVGNAFRGKVDNLFFPVSYPVRSIAAAIDGKVSRNGTGGARGDDPAAEKIRDENETLKYRLAELQKQLELAGEELGEVRRLPADVRKLCRYVAVIGGDPGNQQTLSLESSSMEGLRPDMPVLSQHGLVGKLEVVGLAAARVRLITDRAMTVRVEFRRLNAAEAQWNKVPAAESAATGNGQGLLIVHSYKAVDLEKSGLALGDAATLSDRDWPAAVQGYHVGTVVEIRDGKTPLFKDIVIRPEAELMKLREVMVMVKQK